MLKRFLTSRKAESDHPMWQTIIDIVLFAIVAMIFVLFGYMVIQDQRIHQIYYSKDLSLLQNALYPAHEFMSMQYHGYKVQSKSRLNLGFGNFTYIIDENYTSVNRRWKGSIAIANKDISISYIHLIKPDSHPMAVPVQINYPSAINFTDSNGATQISTKAIKYDSLIKCDSDASYLKKEKGYKTFIYPDDLRVKYLEILSTLSLNPLTSLDSMETYKKQDPESALKYWSMIIIDPGQVNRITIYYPFGEDNSLGCNLYNLLVNDENLKDKDIRLIPSKSVVAFKDRYKVAHNVFIEVNPQLADIGYVMKALAALSRQ
jgi:hypothetical protein